MTRGNESASWTSPARNPAEEILWRELLLAQASGLARRGAYEAAARILDGLGREGREDASVYDIYARMRAQQGRLAEAEELWSRVLHLEPSHAAARAGLDRIAAIRRRARFPISWSAAGLAILALGVLAATFVLLRKPSASESLDRLGAKVQALSERLAPPSARPTSSAPPAGLEGPGLTLHQKGEAWTVVFDEGVFERGVHIPPDAAARLVGLGRRLEPLAGSIAIRIVGYADSRPLIPGGPFKDNIELGMMRAAAVFDLLVRSSRLPPASFSLGSQGEAGTPFPQDEAHAGNNRTVVLTIARTDPGGPDR